MTRTRLFVEGALPILLMAVLLSAGALRASQSAPSAEARVDQVFARWTATTPGCAVGVAQNAKPVLRKAYERPITITQMLKWNENFVKPVVGDAEFAKIQETPGAFNDGRMGSYAMGLMVGDRLGVPNISHSGSTAGYRAHLNRFPEQHLSVAVLCNVSSGAATQYANAVSDIYLGTPARTTTAAAAGGGGRGAGPGGGRSGQQPPAYTPAARQLASYAGTYTSDEAETEFVVAVEGQDLVLRRRPATRTVLRPTAADTFEAGGLGTIRFHRTEPEVTQLGVSQARVFDLRFQKVR